MTARAAVRATSPASFRFKMLRHVSSGPTTACPRVISEGAGAFRPPEAAVSKEAFRPGLISLQDGEAWCPIGRRRIGLFSIFRRWPRMRKFRLQETRFSHGLVTPSTYRTQKLVQTHAPEVSLECPHGIDGPLPFAPKSGQQGWTGRSHREEERANLHREGVGGAS